MPVTKRTDLIIPELMVEAIQGAFPKMRVLMGSRAVLINNTMPTSIQGAALKGGDRITIPYFNIIGDKLDKVANEGDELIPVKLSQTSEEAVVAHYGKAV